IGVIRQKTLRRLQEQSLLSGDVSNGIGTFLAVGELFAVTAGQLLSAVIASGTALRQRTPRD
ncbi:MAG: hypothetical protein LJE75_13505, partial [Gammaproteobacteria bacterium]|nr:hypothetical protein [Gammaproteobacteria bacterium]